MSESPGPRPSVLVLREEWRRVATSIAELCKDESVGYPERVALMHQMVCELEDLSEALVQLGGKPALDTILT